MVVLPAPESPPPPTPIALGTETLVAPPVEQERRAGVMARVLQAPEEQRGVAAPVGALDAPREVAERPIGERRVLAARKSRRLALRPSGEACGQGLLGFAEN